MMMINEDYFRDIEITDSDITTDDNNNSTDDVEKLYSHIQNNYDRTLKIPIRFQEQDDYSTTSSAEIERIFSQVSRNLMSLFDIYGIPHSDVYVTCGPGYLNDDISMIKFNHKRYYTEVIDESSSIYGDDTPYSTIRIFFKRPEFSNLKQMMMFIRTLCNIIWHKNYIKYFRDITLVKDTTLFFRKNEQYLCVFIDQYEYTTIMKNTICWWDFNKMGTIRRKMLYDLSEWFFG